MEVAAGARGTGETRQPGNSTRAGGPEETAAPYAVIAIVPVFCLMGLLGILVCNLLKRKGYHCTANKEVGPGPGGGGSGEAGLEFGGEARGHGLAQLGLGAARGILLGPEGLTGRGRQRANQEGLLEVLHGGHRETLQTDTGGGGMRRLKVVTDRAG